MKPATRAPVWQVGAEGAGRLGGISGEPGSGDLGELPGMSRAAWPDPSAVMEA